MRNSILIIFIGLLLLFTYSACDELDTHEEVVSEEMIEDESGISLRRDMSYLDEIIAISRERIEFVYYRDNHVIQLNYIPSGSLCLNGGAVNWSLVKRYDDGLGYVPGATSSAYNLILGENIIYEFSVTANCNSITYFDFSFQLVNGELDIISGELDGSFEELDGIDPGTGNGSSGAFLP